MPRIAVIGDAMTDRYVECAVDRISPEAPVPVYRALKETDKPGGAANVFENVKGFFPAAELFSNPPDEIVKLRVVSGNHYLARLDFEKPVYADDYAWVEHYDAYIVSDYDKGFVSHRLMELLLKTGKPVYMGGKRKYYGGLELLVLNKEESLCFKRYVPYPPKYYVTTLGAGGARLIRSDGESLSELREEFPQKERKNVDVTGCGDVFLAHLACHMILGKPVEEAIPLANEAAGRSVEVFGTAAIPPCSP